MLSQIYTHMFIFIIFFRYNITVQDAFESLLHFYYVKHIVNIVIL